MPSTVVSWAFLSHAGENNSESMKSFICRLILLVAALSAIQPASAESIEDSLSKRFDTFVSWCSPEKLYLHIDRTIFVAGETLWFKGWLDNASSSSAYASSNYIYVELCNSASEVKTRVKVRRQDSGFPGYLDIPEDLPTGDYTLRAYTLWQLNGDSAYHFNQSIRILGADGGKTEVSREQQGEAQVSFWPESGRYFVGGKAVIAFKVTDAAGRSLDFKAWLKDSRGESIIPVATRHDGMGVFEFIPQEGESYYLEDATLRHYHLPAPSTSGAAINVRKIKGMVYASVIGQGEGEGILLLRDSDQLRPLSRTVLDGKTRTMKAEASMFRTGINHLILTDSRGSILAERLLYIYPDEADIPQCHVATGNMRPAPRSLINSRIVLKSGDGSPLDANCSVSVVRGSLKKHHQDDCLLSYMGLSSELKGKINDPGYYFDPLVPAKERAENMDLLMMIQGWRYYDLETILDPSAGPFKIKYIKELFTRITGRIERRLSSKKMPRNFTFSVFVPKLKFRSILSVDQARTFVIDSLDFEANTEFLINVGSSRFGSSYLPKWDGDIVAEAYAYFPAPGRANARDEEMRIPLVNEAIAVDTLSAAVVSAKSDEWSSGLTFGRSVDPLDLKMYKDRTLVEYLSMRMPNFVYDGENMYNRSSRVLAGFMNTEEEDEDNPLDSGMSQDGTVRGGVALIVDDNRQEWWGYDMLRMEDVSQISISSDPDPLYGGEGGAVMIKLRTGASMVTADRDPSLLYFVPLGHQTPRYFRGPRYDKGETGPFDKRNTIYWNPDVKIRGGSATVSFCNTDQMDYPYYVRIEGRTTTGRFFSHECTLDFKE